MDNDINVNCSANRYNTTIARTLTDKQNMHNLIFFTLLTGTIAIHSRADALLYSKTKQIIYLKLKLKYIAHKTPKVQSNVTLWFEVQSSSKMPFQLR